MLYRRNSDKGSSRKWLTGLITVMLGLGVAGLADPTGARAATVSSGAATAGDQAVHATVSSGASTPAAVVGNPYYLASSTGAVWPLGGANDYGSLAGQTLRRPIVGISTTGDGQGYWLVASDGGVFGFGDAGFHGSTGALTLNQPVIGLTPTPSGNGYWMFAADGGIFSFGDARFYGSTGGLSLSTPIVGMASSNDGRGYWLVGRDGGVFTFGDAGYHGSLAGSGFTAGRIVPDRAGTGYWVVTHAGDVYPFGSAASHAVPTLGVFHSIVGPGDRAMEWAMAQIGKPYQWGGTGPAAFDCSGLVMRAWESVGVTIPRVAADQYGAGPHVAVSQLQIGDLVFWATNPSDPSTIYHVAMYIGGQHIVEAPHTGALVQTNWIGGSEFVEAGTRP